MFTPDFLKDQRVLFVEDEELAREKLAKILGKLFKEVVLASNGLEGLEKYEKSKITNEKIDLIISDINMPIMNGLEMLEKIREVDMVIPLIFTTARGEAENLLKAIDLNVSNYIMKPIDTTVLVKKISEVCEKTFFETQLQDKQKELQKYLDAVDSVALIYKMNENGKISFLTVINPFAEKLEFSLFNNANDAGAIALLIDLSGRVILRKNIMLQRGENRVVFENTNTLAAGIYFLSIKNNQTSIQQKVYKQYR